ISKFFRRMKIKSDLKTINDNIELLEFELGYGCQRPHHNDLREVLDMYKENKETLEKELSELS
ncbi:MAG: hypothetical protein ACRCRT_05340, partial [Cetobacterium somerae]